jgi:hypothetical protein
MQKATESAFSHSRSAFSFVATVVCALAGDANATTPVTTAEVDANDFSSRVAAVIQRLRIADPAISRRLPGDRKTVQFGNR